MLKKAVEKKKPIEKSALTQFIENAAKLEDMELMDFFDSMSNRDFDTCSAVLRLFVEKPGLCATYQANASLFENITDKDEMIESLRVLRKDNQSLMRGEFAYLITALEESIPSIGKYSLASKYALYDVAIKHSEFQDVCSKLRYLVRCAGERHESIQKEQVLSFFNKASRFTVAELTLILPIDADTPFKTSLELMDLLDSPEKIKLARENPKWFYRTAELTPSIATVTECLLLEMQKTAIPEPDLVMRVTEIWTNTAKSYTDGGREVPKGLKLSRKKYPELAKSCYVFQAYGKLEIRQADHASLPNYHHVMTPKQRATYKPMIGDGGGNAVYHLRDLQGNNDYVRYKANALIYLNYASPEVKRFYHEFKDEPRVETGITWEDEEQFYRIAPKKKKGSLDSLAGQGEFATLSLQQQLALFLSMAKAIQVVHHKGWAHRDVKPQNFLVEDDNSLRLHDFDTVIHRDATFPATNAFSPLFTHLNDQGVNTKSMAQAMAMDIYGLGASIKYMYQHSSISAEDAIPPSLRPLYEDLTKANFADRPNIDQVVEALQAILQPN